MTARAPLTIELAALAHEAASPRPATLAYVARMNARVDAEVAAEDRRCGDCGRSIYDVLCTCQEDEA